MTHRPTDLDYCSGPASGRHMSPWLALGGTYPLKRVALRGPAAPVGGLLRRPSTGLPLNSTVNCRCGRGEPCADRGPAAV